MAKINRSLAIIIGIDKYTHIPTLKNAVSDAHKLANLLKNNYNYQVLLLLNQRATKEKLDELLANLENKTIQFDNQSVKVEPTDRMLFYFAGHGFAEEAQDSEDGKPSGYFMPQNAEDGNSKTWLSMQKLYEVFTNLNSHHLLMILDCCFAGRISWVGKGRNAGRSRKLYQQNYDRFIKYQTEQIITSAAHDEKAQDSFRFGQRGDQNGHSPFAHLLLKVLQGNSDGGNDKFIEAIVEDKVITVHELFTYLQNQLGKVAEGQTPALSQPRKYDQQTGEYVFLKGEYIFPLHSFNPQELEILKLDEDTNPYKGLASFENEDSQLFYGRKRLIENPQEGLLSKVSNHLLTVVLGTSGSGKSSLVKAGLIPALKPEEWYILNPMRPGESPLTALAEAILPMRENIDLSSLIKELHKNDRCLTESVKRWSEKNPNTKLLLIIDQSEELITLCRNEQEREDFLHSLSAALASKELSEKLHIVLTLRSEFEPRIRDAIKENHWQKVWQDGRFIVTSMDREELQQVIEEPAAQLALFFESPKLVNDLIDEIAQMPGALPLLSFTLSELYLKYLKAEENLERNDRTITEADYQEIGGVTRSLTQTADKMYTKLVEEEVDEPTKKACESTIRDVMLRMVAISGGELARRRVPTSELVYPGQKNERANKVIDHFVEARLLVKGLDPENQAYVEPVHDALIMGWAKIKYWLDEQQEIIKQGSGWNPIKNLLTVPQALKSLVPLPLTSKEKGRKSDRPEAEKQLKVNLSLQREVNTSANNWCSKKDTAGNKKAVGFLWNADPRLDLLKQALNSEDNWLNKVEAEFVQRSVARKVFNTRRNWSMAIAVMLGLGGLTIMARINEAKTLRESAEINLQKNQSLEGIVDSLKAGKILKEIDIVPLVALITHSLREQVRGTLLRAVYTVRELDRRTENQGQGTVRTSFSPDGNLLASAGENCNVPIRVWDLQGQTFLSKSKPIDPKNKSDNFYHSQTCEPVKIAGFSPNSQQLAAAGANGTVGVWNVRREDKELTKLKIWDTKQGEIKSISFSPDGKLIAATGANGTVLVWNLDNLSEEPQSLCLFNSCYQQNVWSVAFSPDGKRLASTGSDDTIRLWEQEGNEWKENINKFPIPRKEKMDVTSVSFSTDGQKLATAGKDGILRVWDLSDRKLDQKPKEIRTNQDKIWAVSFSTDGQKLATAGDDGTVRLWGLNKLELEKLEGHHGPVRSVSFSRDDQKLASAGDDGTVRLWNLQVNESEKVAVPIDASTDKQKVEIHDGNQSAFGDKDGTVKWQESPNQPPKKMNSSHVGAVNSLAFSPDGNQLASGGNDRTIRLWNVKGGEQESLLPTYAKVNSVAYSPDKHLIASAGEDGKVQLWNLQDLREGEPFAAWKAYHGSVKKVSFSPDGKVLITTGINTGFCKLWPIESFDNLMKQANEKVNPVNGYLEKNSRISRHLCDGS